ncbi:ligand-binding sensor domain-containing protein [Bacteroides sp.]
MKYILFIIMMIQGVLCHAVICKWVSGTTETDNRKVLQMQKDLCGYMWFLTYNGINRYDGVHLKKYDLNVDNAVDSCASYKLCVDNKKELWLLSRDGNVLSYNRLYDRFERYIDLRAATGVMLSYLCLDNRDNAWFSTDKEFYICNLPTKKIYRIRHAFGEIFSLLPVKDWKYYLSSESGIYSFNFSGNTLSDVSSELSDGCYNQVYKMFYSQEADRFVFVDRSEGLGVYDCSAKKLLHSRNNWKEKRVRCLKAFKDKTVLMATEGSGIYCINLENCQITPFLNADLEKESLIHSNRVVDLFVDENRRVWIAGFPNGVFRFDKHMHKTQYTSHPCIYLDNFNVFYQPVTVATKDSPLQLSINYTKVLKLNYNQNTFSFTATSINYDMPEDIVYSWRLNNEAWTTPTKRNVVCFSNLTPGEHLVSIRALSAKNGNPISQRNMLVIIHPPLWQTKGAFLCYGIILALLGMLFVKALRIWKERNLSRETIKVFVNSTKEICMPLTLIKNPLENLCQKYPSDIFKDILQQVKGMDHMLTELVTIGHLSSHPKKLSLLETELTMYLNETIGHLSPLVEQKNIKLHWDGTPGFLRVWIDKEKMTAIIKGILEVIVDCINDGEEIELTTAYTLRNWEMKLEFACNGNLKKKLC